jgi:predicted CXXCH cytochrome family protein
MTRLLRAVVVAALMLSALVLRADTHPVPLEKNVDAAKCLECHEDKSKGPHVHSAIQMGCTSCHEVRTSKDVTRVKLITTSSGKLCLTCHADKNAADLKGKVHPPAVRDCVKCHDPHQSKNDKQLLKPVSGDKQENLCLSCHNVGLNVGAKGSRHAALDMGCDTCHTVHKVGDPSKAEFANHLKKSTPALCLDCHDGNDAALQKTHNNQPFAKADCLECHNPHQSDRPKLMQAVVHAPFDGGTSSCSTCHEPMKDGKIVLTAATPKELCVTCHSEKAEQIDKAKVQHPGAMGDCTDCHNPHASRTSGLPKPDAVNVCLSCHTDQAALRSKKHPHQPAFEQGCATCHEPHGGDNEHLLRAKDENTLCLECHGPDAPEPKAVAGQPLIAIFDGRVKLPQDYFRNVTVLPIKYGRGHPVEHHPVKDLMGPDSNSKVSTPLGCGSCHQPHASAQANLLVKDQSANMQFCAACHSDLGK